MANLKNERIFNNITETIGKTPLVRLSKFEKHIGTQCEIIAKLEFFFVFENSAETFLSCTSNRKKGALINMSSVRRASLKQVVSTSSNQNELDKRKKIYENIF